MRNFIVFLFLIMHALIARSQATFSQSWDYRYGGSGFDFPSKLLKTYDNGFLISGNSLSSTGYDKSEDCRNGLDYWIVKTDSNGVKVWDKTFGGSETDNLTTAIQLPDSGYLLGGYSLSGMSGDKSRDNFGYPIPADDYWIVRIDRNGNKIWDRSFGGDKKDRLNALLLLPDGNYLLGGYSFSDSTGDMSHHKYGDNDYWIVKVDPSGNKIWDMNFGGSFDDRLVSLALTPDEKIILAGYSNSPPGILKSQPPCNGTYDFWIIKINQDGTKIWDRTIGGNNKDDMCCMAMLPSGKMIFCGITFPGIGCDKTQDNWGIFGYCDFWAVCTDASGNKLWDYVYGGDRNEDDVNNVAVTPEGFMISGCSYSFITGNKTEDNIMSSEQPWVFTIDTLGNMLWDKTIHNPAHSEFGYAIPDGENCFVVLSNVISEGGYVTQSRNTADDCWIGKFCFSNIRAVADYTCTSNTLCQNTCIDFTNLSRNATAFQWLFPGGNPSSDTMPNPQNICYFNQGTYDVTLIARNASDTDTLTLSNFLVVFPEIQFTPLQQRNDTLFSVPGFVSYTWYHDTTLIEGENNYYYVASQNGNYTVMVVDSNGCQAAAAILQIYTSNGELHQTGNQFTAQYDAGLLHVKLNDSHPSYLYVELTDALGRLIFQEKPDISNGENFIHLPVEFLQNGIYFVRIRSESQLLTFKIY